MKARRKKVYPASRPYEEGLDERLKSLEYAIEYLNAIIEKTGPDFYFQTFFTDPHCSSCMVPLGFGQMAKSRLISLTGRLLPGLLPLR